MSFCQQNLVITKALGGQLRIKISDNNLELLSMTLLLFSNCGSPIPMSSLDTKNTCESLVACD